MTRPNIEAIRARLEATTPGKWEWTKKKGRFWCLNVVDKEHNDGEIVLDSNSMSCFLNCTDADASFIVSAHQDIPALLAYIEEQAAEIGELREALKNERIISQMLRDRGQSQSTQF